MKIKMGSLKFFTFILICFLFIMSCNDSYKLKNDKVEGSYYKITDNDNKILIEKFSENKVFFDYNLIKKGDTYFFSNDDKLLNERGNAFLSLNNVSRTYSYMNDLDGNPIKDSLLINNSNGVFKTTIKSIKIGYQNGFIFYYDKNFKIDSILSYGSKESFLYK